MTKIITSTDALKTHIEGTRAIYRNAGNRMHVDIVSAIWHACKNGDPSLLNLIVPVLRSNDLQAVKMYARRIQVINGLDGYGDPEGLPTDVINEALDTGAVLTFEKGEFRVIKGHTSDAAKSLASLCEARFIDPDGEVDKKVFDRNNFAETAVLGDSEAIDAVLKAIKAASTSTDRKVIATTDATKKLFEQMADTLSVRKEQLTLSAG